MKKVFRMLGLCALIALAITSCKKNETTKEMTFSATITQPTDGTRTHIDAEGYLVWDANNAITVFNADGLHGIFTTSAQDIWEQAPFTGSIIPTEPYTAFYPNAVINGNNVTLALSANQNYVANNTFTNDTYPMAAVNGNEEFFFHSPAGVLRLELTSVNPCTVGSIVLTGGANDVLAGDLVYPYNFTDILTDYTVENPTNVVTLNCGEGVALSTTGTFFNLVTLNCTFPNGFTVMVKDLGGNEIISFTAHASAINHIGAERILKMPAKAVEYTLPTVHTNAATNVATTTATINGDYTAPASAPVTACGFYYGTDPNNMTSVSCPLGSPMNYNLSGLTPNTTYYFQAWATNAGGTNTGAVLTFQTQQQVSAPAVQTVGHEIVGTSANLTGNLTSDGNAACTVGIQFATNSAFTQNVQTLAVSGTHNAPYSFTQSVSDLQYNVTYYYRAYATNGTGGTIYGETMSFVIEWVGHFCVEVDGADNPLRFVHFATGLLWWDNDVQEFAFEHTQYDFHRWMNDETGPTNASFGQFCWSHEFNDYGKNNTGNQTGHGFVDWGTLTIRKSGTGHGTSVPAQYDAPNTWRTLTYNEWECIRTHHAHIRKTRNGVRYMVLLPYGMTAEQGASYNNTQLMNMGAAFFPMCGNSVDDPNQAPASWGYGEQICLWTASVATDSGNWGSAGAVWLYYENGGYTNLGGMYNSYYHRMQVRLAVDE